MGIAWRASTDDAGLGGNERKMGLITLADRLGQRGDHLSSIGHLLIVSSVELLMVEISACSFSEDCDLGLMADERSDDRINDVDFHGQVVRHREDCRTDGIQYVLIGDLDGSCIVRCEGVLGRQSTMCP